MADLNATISATPELMRAIMRGLRAAGHEVHILTGCDKPEVTPEVIAEKLAQLDSLNFRKGIDYDTAVAVSGPESEVAQRKVEYMRHVGAAGLIDDKKRNIKAVRAAGFMGIRHVDPRDSGQAPH